MRHIFNAARAPTLASFEFYMDQMKVLKPASYASMMRNPPALWANYACRDNVIWDQATTNMSESANNMVGDEVNAGFVACVSCAISGLHLAIVLVSFYGRHMPITEEPSRSKRHWV